MWNTRITLVTCVLMLRGNCYEHNAEDNEKPRIVWGQEAKEDEFPFVAALLYIGYFICTSSMITPDILITAAHCVVGEDDHALPAKHYTAVLGNVDRTSGETRVTFDSIIPHESYDSSSVANDIALMKLSSSVKFTDKIQPICISQPDKTYDGKSGLAIGWGRDQNFEVPETLHYVEVDVPTILHCQLAYKAVSLNQIEISRNHICAGSRMKGVCNGDSGGPLVLTTDDDKRFTAGVTSFGSIFGCGVLAVPAVYTSISHYNQWILKNAKPSTPCVV